MNPHVSEAKTRDGIDSDMISEIDYVPTENRAHSSRHDNRPFLHDSLEISRAAVRQVRHAARTVGTRDGALL